MRDQNGRKVYEGDRVKAYTYWGKPIDYPREIDGRIVYKRGGYCVDGIIHGCRRWFRVSDCWCFRLVTDFGSLG